MVVMNLKLNNFYAFKNFQMNMSYPKKIVDSFIENEHLVDRPNFRYKKINIIMGSNATGKSSIGNALMSIFVFITRKEYTWLVENICDKSRSASFSIDIVLANAKLYRIEALVSPCKDEEYKSTDIEVSVKAININKNDSYEKCIKRLEAKPFFRGDSYIESLEQVKEPLSWLFSYAMERDMPRKENIDDDYLNVLEYTLKALDSSIVKVEKVENVEGSYFIQTKHEKLLVQDGEIVKEKVLSSGTRAGLDIAYVVSSIKNKDHGFYYCDEKFSFVHSDIEKTFLSLMISSLTGDAQLFFTTHNADILDLSLPRHSFVFLKKDADNNEEPIKCVQASDYIKRNTDSLRNAVDNDLFAVAPSLDLIYKIDAL